MKLFGKTKSQRMEKRILKRHLKEAKKLLPEFGIDNIKKATQPDLAVAHQDVCEKMKQLEQKRSEMYASQNGASSLDSIAVDAAVSMYCDVVILLEEEMQQRGFEFESYFSGK